MINITIVTKEDILKCDYGLGLSLILVKIEKRGLWLVLSN